MNIRKNSILAAMVAIAGASVAVADIELYSQDFEGLDALSPTALGDDGWLVGANVFNPAGDTFLYNYFAFPAPNGSGAFSNVAVGEGGAPQGQQQLVVFSDYNNADHNIGNRIEGVVFRESIIGAGDVGSTITFQFDAKGGDLAGDTTARAFIKTLDPGAGFATTNFIIEDTTSIAGTWNTYSLSLNITAGLVGQIFQIGFDTTASNFDPSGNFYDNISVVPTPASAALLGLGGLAATRRRRS